MGAEVFVQFLAAVKYCTFAGVAYVNVGFFTHGLVYFVESGLVGDLRVFDERCTRGDTVTVTFSMLWAA